MTHLDTSFLIRALVRGSAQDRHLRHWIREGESLGISAIGWAEFLCGPLETSAVALAARIVSERIPFTDEDAMLAAHLYNEPGRRRGSLTDCMIAATAVRAGVPLATVNPSDFRRFEAAGLVVVTV